MARAALHAACPKSPAASPTPKSPPRRGLHSSTFRLTLSAYCRTGVHSGIVQGVIRRCQGVLRSIRGCSGCILCQKRHRLS